MVAASDNSDRYNIYTPRRLSRLGEGYSLFVKTLKFVLPLMVLIIVGVLIGHLSVDNQQAQIAEMPEAEKTMPGQVEVVEPKYESIDEKGQDYTITADSASRATDGGDGVLFNNPLADIVLDNKTWLALKSAGGFFNRESEKLALKDKVTIFHDSGYEFSLSNIDIDLKDKTAQTTSPVNIKGPMGTLDAKDMSVTDNGNRVTFGGPILLKIFTLTASGKLP